MAHRIALVHALRASMAPIEVAFAEAWPQAVLQHLLDDALPGDLERAGRIDAGIEERFVRLARYAVDAGADAVLFTCSAFGGAIDAARAAVAVPVVKPNEAMLDEAVRSSGDVVLLATFAPTLASMVPEFEAAAAAIGRRVRVRPVLVAGAMDAVSRGAFEAHDALIVDAAIEHAGGSVVVALAQFSMARAAPLVRRRLGAPVLTTPESAVAGLRRRLESA
jgi:aspartate/glutamate racemase